jgi:DNA-binding FadR family transcriptional regulator
MTSPAPEPELTGPIGRKTVSELVIARILELIRAGRLAPGARLPSERELAAQLAVSRPTLREALRALSIIGVLEVRHGGGVFVTSLEAGELLDPLNLFMSLSAENMGELFDARIAFEPLVAGLAASRLGPEALARLDGLVAAQRAAPDDAELFNATDIEFHKTILEASGNAFLSRIGKVLQVLGETGRKAFQARRDVRLRSIADHEAILAALGARDRAAAEAAMAAHMRHVRAALREVTGA